MKKVIFQSFIALSLMQAIGANAQLTVTGAGAFVYVGDELLYVDKEVKLNNGGNLYLRRGGQLLQSSKAASLNEAAGGVMSAYVMSNPTNQYSYTHYGLPVSHGTTGFTVSPTSIGRPSSVTEFVNGNLNGNAANDGNALVGGTIRLNRDFIAWYQGSNQALYSAWKYPIKNSGDNPVPRGMGLYLKGTTGTDAQEAGEGIANKASASAAQRIEFRGVPNDGNISVPVIADALYNVGNPYPSSFNINQFMTDNANIIEGVYYYVEVNKNTHQLSEYNYGYAQYTISAPGGIINMPAKLYKSDSSGTSSSVVTENSGLVNIPQATPFIGIGAGFWVYTKAAGNLVFNNNQRGYTTIVQDTGNTGNVARPAKDQDYGYFDEIINLKGIDYTKISKAPNPMVSISAATNKSFDAVALVFDDNAQDTYIHLSDVLSKSEDPDFKVYIEGADNKYRLKMSKFDLSKKTPITIESKTEQPVAFKIDNIVNFKGSDKVYIYDDYTGVYKDISNENVDITIPAGVTKGRYYITFSKDNSNLVDQNVMNNAFVVLQNNKDKALTINNPEGFDVVSTEVFDIQGKLILSKKNLGTGPEFRFSTSNFADGIYIVKIGTNNGKSVSKKVAVKN